MFIFGFILPFLVSVAAVILLIVSHWVLFEKMDEPGWKALVPFYSQFIFYKKVWSPAAYFCSLACSCVYAGCYGFISVSYSLYRSVSYLESGAEPSLAGIYIVGILLLISSLASFALSFIFNLKTSRCFGHDYGYCLGLTFLAPVFIPVLAFGDSEYSPEYEEFDQTDNYSGESLY